LKFQIRIFLISFVVIFAIGGDNTSMLDELKTANKVIGIKQATKAVESGKAKKAFIAKDADSKVVDPFKQLCDNKSVIIEYAETKKELGKACGIDVGAAVAVII